MSDPLIGAVDALVAHARSLAPAADATLERLCGDVLRAAIQAGRIAAPIAAEALTIGVPIGELCLRTYLISQLGPVFGPGAADMADFLINGAENATVARLRAAAAPTSSPTSEPSK